MKYHVALFHILPACFFVSTSALNSSTCYNPDKSQASSGNIPCFPSQDVSPCCGIGSLCTNTGLCVPGGVSTSELLSSLVRGTCTDQNWQSSECPQYCLSASTGGTNLISCQNVTNNDRDFCCDHSNGCCDSGIGRFRLTVEEIVVATIASGGASQLTTLTTSISSASSSTLASGETTSTISITPSSSIPNPASTPASPAASSSSSATATSSSSNKNTNAVKIGAGVGVPVLIIALSLSCYLIYAWRRKRKTKNVELAELHSSPAPQEVEEYGKYSRWQTMAQELDGRSRSELPTN
ncbi:hypothetical protein K432DRAFT_361103 [Lepidopterella palustris CBS 459.81]|uniref:Mid2 domain-containing protein n=1 Tax=Lepidopterella palustris CBS 459.81 TaxID=1314670 RepID=A0A8E2E296_9PEZI|nr:hypothetical protein K432DRAFT_361103 [Lepidopterella palustris CBS 459.81]